MTKKKKEPKSKARFPAYSPSIHFSNHHLLLMRDETLNSRPLYKPQPSASPQHTIDQTATCQTNKTKPSKRKKGRNPLKIHFLQNCISWLIGHGFGPTKNINFLLHLMRSIIFCVCLPPSSTRLVNTIM